MTRELRQNAHFSFRERNLKVNEFREILKQLKTPFPPEQHQDRSLPGGGRWFYIPWQNIRERLDEICPEWQMSWTEPSYVGDFCCISCTITICGISRQAPGNAQIQLLSSSGKDMSRGTPLERATADAFKNAAEAFGIARYLDDQPFVVGYLKSKGDMRGYKYHHENAQIEAGARGKTETVKKKRDDRPGSMLEDMGDGNYQPVNQPQVSQVLGMISEPQIRRLWAIGRSELKLSDETIKAAILKMGFESSKVIPQSKYDWVINSLRDLSKASF